MLASLATLFCNAIVLATGPLRGPWANTVSTAWLGHESPAPLLRGFKWLKWFMGSKDHLDIPFDKGISGPLSCCSMKAHLGIGKVGPGPVR